MSERAGLGCSRCHNLLARSKTAAARTGTGSAKAADMAATTHVFTLPAEVTARPVTVAVTFSDYDEEFALELP